MKKNLREELSILKALTLTEWSFKRQSSVLGMTLSLLNPIITFALAFFIYSDFGKGIINNFWLSIFIAIIHWEIFISITGNCINSYISKVNILKSYRFSDIIPVLSHFLAGVIASVIELALFFIIIIYATDFTFITFLTYLGILSLLYAFIFFSGVILSLMRVYMQDVEYIWPIIIRMLFIATPVLYDPMIIPKEYVKYLMVNPLFHYVIMIKYCFQGDAYLPYFNFSYALSSTIVMGIVAFIFYKSVKTNIMEKI